MWGFVPPHLYPRSEKPKTTKGEYYCGCPKTGTAQNCPTHGDPVQRFWEEDDGEGSLTQ